MNHMLHGAVARIGGAIKRIEGADGAKYSVYLQILQILSFLRLISKQQHCCDNFDGDIF